MKVYLAGPITGESYKEATNWRHFIASELEPQIECLSPMRGKEYLKDHDIIQHSYPDTILSNSKAILARDHFDCTRCTAIVVNLLESKEVSIGTVMEIAWGFTHQKPVICAVEKDNPHYLHPMIRESISFRVDTLEQLVDTTRIILNR